MPYPVPKTHSIYISIYSSMGGYNFVYTQNLKEILLNIISAVICNRLLVCENRLCESGKKKGSFKNIRAD